MKNGWVHCGDISSQSAKYYPAGSCRAVMLSSIIIYDFQLTIGCGERPLLMFNESGSHTVSHTSPAWSPGDSSPAPRLGRRNQRNSNRKKICLLIPVSVYTISIVCGYPCILLSRGSTNQATANHCQKLWLLVWIVSLLDCKLLDGKEIVSKFWSLHALFCYLLMY